MNAPNQSKYFFYILHFAFCILTACSTQKRLGKEATADILSNKDFKSAHVGISIFDPANNKYLYNYQGDKYFVPASNTKLFTAYAAMKYLGDSIVGAKYIIHDDGIYIQATGDPTFLHPDFKDQRLYKFLSQPQFEKIQIATPFAAQSLGRGWAWDDYTQDYMAERDPFPMYGNVATISYNADTFRTIPPSIKNIITGTPEGNTWDITRKPGGHFFSIVNGRQASNNPRTITLPMEKGAFAATYLRDTLHKEVVQVESNSSTELLTNFYSQPLDSLLKPLMHRSDNFFAEQTLLMVSDKVLGLMNDYSITDSLLNSLYKEVPQKPKWVDGSGLSRYNLFTPQDFVWVVNKMITDFGMQRVKEILPTGGEGTLSSFYKNQSGNLYAKTGTLSNHVALSGFFTTRKNKTLIFSVLVNAHQASAANIRKAVEQFITSVIDKY